MSKVEILEEIKQTIGIVPGFFEMMPEDSLEFEWRLFKRYTLQEKGEIPPKYREVIGLGAAVAKHIHGATDAEVEEAVQIARFGASWSACLNGALYGKEKFMQELHAVGAYLTK